MLPGGCQCKEKTLTCLIQTGESFSLHSILGLLCLLQADVGRFFVLQTRRRQQLGGVMRQYAGASVAA